MAFLLRILFVSWAALLFHKIAAQPFQVNSRNNSPNEVTVAISKQQAGLILGASNLNNLYRSTDGGLTWSEGTVKSRFGFYGDPVLYAATDGSFYLVHLSFTPGKNFPGFIDRIVFQRSTDGGLTWTQEAAIGLNGEKVQDKPWITRDENPQSPFYGRIYVSWTEFDKYESKKKKHKSRIRMSWSEDQGKTFTAPVVISQLEGNCLDDDKTPEGAVPAVLENGTVAIAWAFDAKLYFTQSQNGGVSWTVPTVAAQQPGGWTFDVPFIYRANGLPFLFSGKVGDTELLYLVYARKQKETEDADIMICSSADAGKTWGSPKSIGDTTGEQFFVHAAVDGSTGALWVVAYDRSGPGQQYFQRLVLHKSTDGGNSFQTVQLPGTYHPVPDKRTFFGDYIAVDAWNDNWIVLWTGVKSDGQLAVYGYKGKTDPPAALVEQEPRFLFTGKGKKNKLHLLVPAQLASSVSIGFLYADGETINQQLELPAPQAQYRFLSLPNPGKSTPLSVKIQLGDRIFTVPCIPVNP